ncbi:efflux RND transporter periplasmic adaptor subunit, partial [Novosphingobium sp.]|uniref:efflux RND transporter periplasmic adaptor subunit n=1 Tax=Novosphingobium sp. TaxID=1874826 RepID=UPI0035AEAAE2
MNFDSRIDANEARVAPGAGSEDHNPLLDTNEEDRLSRRRLALIAAAVVLLLVGIAWWNNAGKVEGGASKDQAPVVSVITPGRTTIAGEINVTGSLAARRELPVGIAGEGGQVVSVLVEPGQWVRAGQVLAVIDRSVQTQQQASQAAQIQVARANAELAQSNLERGLKLVDRGFVSKADIDRLTATRDAAVAQVHVAEAQLGVLHAQTNRLNIVAPSAGLVLERKVEPGQVVSAGSGVLFRIAKDGEMELKAQLGQVDLAQIALGVAVEVTPVGSKHTYTGQVWQISPTIDPSSRQGVARVALAYAPDLRPGGFAGAVIKSGTVVAPMLPESAILSDNAGSYVYV